LFGSAASSADLKVGVLVDDIKGRFCVDCPNILNPKGIPATVLMNAHWEIFSTLDRRVVAKIDTSGGVDSRAELNDSVMPAILEAFRENTRQLLASEEFRGVVLDRPSSKSTPAPLDPMTFRASKSRGALSESVKSVAVVYASDGSGSGFLISGEGLVLTNEHVVGGSKYVKLKWSDGAEAMGEVIRADPRRDVALIKTDPKGRLGLPLKPGGVQLGQPVFAIGTPLRDAFQNTLTKGIVSATRVEGGLAFIQSDVAVTHGNSGGPLLDEKGAVVGITDMGAEENGAPVGLNLFIPIDDALRALSLTAQAPPS